MGLEILVRDDVSVTSLMEVARTLPVVRTPHVGNNSMYNLLAAKCGFPAVWVDTNLPGRDWNYNPQFLVKNGIAVPLVEGQAASNTLVSHLSVTNSELSAFVGVSLSDLHISQMRRVFPKTRIETHTEYFVRHEEIARKVIEMSTDAEPSTWYRIVADDGRIARAYRPGEKTGVQGWKDIRNNVLFPPRTGGWVTPNVLVILLDIVIQSKEGDSADVWVLSGPDLVQYISKMESQLERLYKTVSEKLGLRRDIRLHVVPLASFRLAVRRSHKGALDRLVGLALSGAADRNQYRTLADECPDVWVRTGKRDYYSQHDMNTPDDIYAPEELLSLPLRLVQGLVQCIETATGRKSQ